MIGTPHQAIRYALLMKKQTELREFLEGWLNGKLPEWDTYFPEFIKTTDPGPSVASAVELAGVRTVLLNLLGLDDQSTSTDDILAILVERYTFSRLEGSKLSAVWLKEAGYKKASRAVSQEVQLALLRHQLEQAQKEGNGDGK